MAKRPKLPKTGRGSKPDLGKLKMETITLDCSDPWDTTPPSKDSDPPNTDSKDFGFANRFAAVIDPAFSLSEDAARRIERQLRQAVLAEIAAVEYFGEITVSSVLPDGSRGIVVSLTR